MEELLNHRVHVANASQVLDSAVTMIASIFKSWSKARLLWLFDFVQDWVEIAREDFSNELWLILADCLN